MMLIGDDIFYLTERVRYVVRKETYLLAGYETRKDVEDVLIDRINPTTVLTEQSAMDTLSSELRRAR